MKKPISFSNFNKEISEGGKPGLWANIHKRRKAGKAPKKPGDKGYPKTLDIEGTEGFASDAQRKAAFASGYKAKNKKEAYEPITTARAQAFAKADAEPRKKVSLPPAPWDKKPKANTKGTNVTYNKSGKVVKEGGFSRMDYQKKSGEKGTGLDTFKKKPAETDLEKTRRMAKDNTKPAGTKITSKRPNDEVREAGPKIKLPMRNVSVKGIAKDAEKYASKDKRAADGGPTDAQKAGSAKFHAANKLQPGRPKSAAQKDKIKDQPMEAFSSRAIVKKDRQGSGKPMAGGSDAHKAAVKKYIGGMKSNRPGNTLPRQMKDPKKDAMVSKGGKVKVIDKNKEDDHIKKGYVRAEDTISKELFMKSEMNMSTMKLLNKMKKASPAAKKALEAPSRVDNKDDKKVAELTIADVVKGTEKAKKRQEKERKATGKTSTSTTDLAARREGKAYGPTGVSYSDEPNLVSKPKKDLKAHKVAGRKSGPHKEDADGFDARAIMKKAKAQGARPDQTNKILKRNSPAHKAAVKKHIDTMKSNRPASRPTTEDVDEALDMKQRLARGRSARKNKSKLAMGRKRAGRRIASMKVLRKRAMRAARKTLTKRLTKGIAKTDLSVSRKREIEKRLDKPAFKIKASRLVKRTIKDIRKKEIARKRK